jgi:hypothetical protein
MQQHDKGDAADFARGNSVLGVIQVFTPEFQGNRLSGGL